MPVANCADVREQLARVPPFPAIATKLLATLEGSEIKTAEIARLVRSDPSLTARVLKNANSPIYGLRSQIHDVHHAITLIGFDRVRQIVVAGGAARYLGARQSKEIQLCWQHSLASAVLCDELAKPWPAFSKTAFTAGILHDIGRLVLLATYPQYLEAIRGRGPCVDLLDVECELFGIDHAEAGRLLIETWQLPSEFLAVAGRHHDRCAENEVDLLRIVQVACQMADALGYGILPLANDKPDVTAIANQLPKGSGARYDGDPEDLYQMVQAKIQEAV